MPALGLSLSVGSPTTPLSSWDPSQIADLAVFLHFASPHCFVSNGGAVSGVGDVVGYVEPLYGTTISVEELVLKPTLRADGLELDALGVNKLILSSALPGTGNFTVYWAFIGASGALVAFMDDVTGGTLLGGVGDISIFDSFFNPFNIPNDFLGEVVLGRFSFDAGTVEFEMIGSGQVVFTGTAEGSPTFPFSQIGGTGAIGAGNDSTDNRYRLLIYVDRKIALNSAEDLLIRDWITTNTGASL